MLVEEHTTGELKISGIQFEIVPEKRILITELKLCQEGPVFDRSLNENNWQRESDCLILHLQSMSIAHVREYRQKITLILTTADFNAFHVLSDFQLAQIKDANYETTLQKFEYCSVFWGEYVK